MSKRSEELLARMAFEKGERGAKKKKTPREVFDEMGRAIALAQRAAEARKATNPKTAVGRAKVPLESLSPVAAAWHALAMFKGRLAYGGWNWRGADVPASIYVGAMKRHTDDYLSGETFDEDGLHNLGCVMACCSILIDAEEAKTLIDDRPPSVSLRRVYAEVQARMAVLTERYKDKPEPKHFTIANTDVE